MKKFLIMAVIMLSSVNTFAQQPVGTFTIAPKVGMNIANLTDMSFEFGNKMMKLSPKPRIGLAVGVEGEYQISELFSLSAGVMYSMQGLKYSEKIAIPVVGEQSLEATGKLDYINIPIMANVYVLKGLAVKLGIQPGFNIASKLSMDMKGAMSGGNEEDPDIKDAIQSVDISIPIGVSYEYANVVFDARYNWGLSNVFTDKRTRTILDDFIPGKKSKNSVFQISVGYKFAL